MRTKSVRVFLERTHCALLLVFLQLAISLALHEKHAENKIPIIYDSSGIDGQFQTELAKAAILALSFVDKKDVKPLLIDISRLDRGKHAKQKCVKILIANQCKVAVSVLEGDELIKFAHVYERLGKRETVKEKLHIYTPRSISLSENVAFSIEIKSLQMSDEAKAVALLNRVRNVGVQTLIPVMDGDSASQFRLLKSYTKLGQESKWKIKFTKPLLLNDVSHTDNLKAILKEYTGFHESRVKSHNLDFDITDWPHTKSKLKPGILLLASNASRFAMKIASEKNHLLLSWFSPNILDFEEWAYDYSTMSDGSDNLEIPKISEEKLNNSTERPLSTDSFFGLYTLNFVGSKGWDNPVRRRLLQELSAITGASPRILSAVLTYDAVRIARDHIRNELKFPMSGVSGIIEFNKFGHRRNGTYLGTTSVSNQASPEVTLLQPSTWILEDIISVKEKGQIPQITDYDIATSSILTKYELLSIANSTKSAAGCNEHVMNIMTYDPFNQMPYHYFFSKENVPNTIVVPNQQGYGITFLCTHNFTSPGLKNYNATKYLDSDAVVSTLQLACAPGERLSYPVKCFRSRVNRRQKRSSTADRRDKSDTVPSVQYQYSLSGNDPWGSHNTNQYYYKPIGTRDYQVDAGGYHTTRLDVPIEEVSTPAPAAPPPKLPELRQILKAAKPFVGSCIGSSTGCAVCVLVLGRLPLGTAPGACTGPCFVGTFGSCGSLLGRVFSETTVICTELFRQGLLDSETFIADAEFGRYMSNSSPYTMEGYRILATPLVESMKTSQIVTNIVATFALPWAHHMKYLLGRSNETNWFGSSVHSVGYPICNLAGRIYFGYNHLKTYCVWFASPLIPLLLALILIITLSPNLRLSMTNERFNIFHCVILIYTLLSTSKQVLRTGLYYFKAIGRRT